MAAVRTRQAIASPDLTNVAGWAPLSYASSIFGVRIFDVGQGDSIAILADVGGVEEVVLQLDYGGRERNPLTTEGDVDIRMPVTKNKLLMLTHWDEDHWSSAPKGSLAKGASWVVPRQVTSPRAVRFSAQLNDIHCIPESQVGQTIKSTAANGDYVLFEKIGSFPGAFAKNEDCNKTGVALAVVRRSGSGDEAILLPGDAPFDQVAPFRRLEQQGVKLRGIVAFHHGAGTHWTTSTEQLLKNWSPAGKLDVVFSCSRPNSYGHPEDARYRALLPHARFRMTADARLNSQQEINLIF